MNPSTINLENSIGPSFALAQGESIFLPYGDYRHKAGLQRVDATAAERMALALSGLVGKIKRIVTTAKKDLPIYIGHPDVPGRGAEFPDKRAYGWVTSIAAENDGIRLDVRWTPAGRELIEDGSFRYYSPYWEAEQEGRLLRPVELLSVGLTNNPNIPVPPLANDGGDDAPDEGEPEEQPEDPSESDTIMKKQLAALLGKDENASEEDLLAEVTRLVEAAKPAENGEEPGAAEEEAPPAPDPEEEERRRAAENDRLVAAVRAERVGAAVDALALAGKIAVADRAAVTDRLVACENEADYATLLESLRAGRPALKTEAVTDGLAAEQSKARAANDASAFKLKRSELMDAEMKANGGDFTRAWEKMSRLHPAYF